MLDTLTTDLLIYAAIGATLTTSSLAAHRSYKMSILDDIIGDKQLIHMLRQRGLMDSFIQGTIYCSVCGEVLHRSNLRLITANDAELGFTCGKLSCTSRIIADQARRLDISVAG